LPYKGSYTGQRSYQSDHNSISPLNSLEVWFPSDYISRSRPFVTWVS